MDVSPDALYSNLLVDLRPYINEELLKIYKDRKDFPVGATTKEVAAISIARSLLKKYRYASNDRRDATALLKFLEVNNRCEKWELQLKDSWEETLYGHLRVEIEKFWNKDATHEAGYLPWRKAPLVEHPYDLLKYGELGPGANIRGRGGDFYTKLFDSPLSCTSDYLYQWYRRYVRSFSEWSNAEETRRANYGNHVAVGNRLDFVPKNDETSRTICVEPTLNMFFQLGLGHHLELRLLSRFGINLADQQFKNRELARRGSIDDSLATIDLESASDSMSLGMLKSVLPSDFFGWLMRLRSPQTEVPGLGYMSTGMVSTMGNGFTFPLQTMLFACVVVACFRARGLRPRYPRGDDWGDFGVNGDDIIVPKGIYRDVVCLLSILGFSVNRSKTFYEGPFRESCGGDYYNGRFVRGVYVKSLDTPQARYSAINQLNLFSFRTGVQLPHTVRYLLKTVKWLPVPRWESDESGIQLPLFLLRPALDKRTQSYVYWRWVPHSKKMRIAETAIVVPRGSRPRKFNPSGLYLCFLQRSVNSFSIGVRHDAVSYGRKRGVAPNWDTPRVTHPLSGWEPEDERWKTAVYLNVS